VWFVGEVRSEEPDGLMARFHVQSVVIDGQPDGHSARAFATRHSRNVWVAHYHHAPGHERIAGGSPIAPPARAFRSTTARWSGSSALARPMPIESAQSATRPLRVRNPCSRNVWA